MLLDNDEIPTGDDRRLEMDIQYLIRQIGNSIDEAPNPIIRLRRQMCIDSLKLAANWLLGDRLV